MGTINFVWRFVPDFTQIVKPLQQMVKQNAQFKRTEIEKNAFSKIKPPVAHAPSLKSPYFDKDFILYTFASDDLLAAVLTQKRGRGGWIPNIFHEHWSTRGRIKLPIHLETSLCSIQGGEAIQALYFKK